MSDWGVGFDVQIKGMDEQLKKLERFGAIAEPRLRQAMSDSVTMVEAEAKKKAPVGVTGKLRSSISSRVQYANGTDVRGVVGAYEAYAAAVEKGARAHYPPVANIAYWVDRKIGYKRGRKIYAVSLGIARSIAMHGTPARPYIQPAMESKRGAIVKKFKAALDQIANDLAVKGG